MRFKRQGKAELAPQIISSEDPQPDHQQMPVENCVNTVRVPRGRCNVRGFKRDGTTFHQSEKVLFQKMDADAILEVTTGGTVLTTQKRATMRTNHSPRHFGLYIACLAGEASFWV